MVVLIKNARRLLIVALLLITSACTIMPGMHISGDRPWVGHLSNQQTDASSKVHTQLITPQLLNELRSVEPVAQISRSLQVQMDEYSYIIGVGDVLSITVWDHPELTIPAGQFRSAGESGNVVHPDGTIFYPYIGSLKVAGKPVGEARTLIASSLAKYIESPQVEVSVAAYRSQRIFVTGAVTQPSVLPITNIPMTLLDAVNAAGGLGVDADWRSVVLTSEDKNGTTHTDIDLYALYQKGDMSQNVLLGHNDIVHVPRNDALKVFVMGDVVKPTTQRIDRSGLTLAEAISNVGGIDEVSADASGIFVLRASQQEGRLADVFQLDASDGGMLILSTQFELKPLDIVYVTSAPLARWNKIVSQLLPTLNGLYFAKRSDADLN
jgi:polysaccharide biosynthesis/export protein